MSSNWYMYGTITCMVQLRVHVYTKLKFVALLCTVRTSPLSWPAYRAMYS